MNSPLVASRRLATSRTDPGSPLSDRVAAKVGARATAKDDAARTPFDPLKDPLWMLAIAMGAFFALMAAVITLG